MADTASTQPISFDKNVESTVKNGETTSTMPPVDDASLPQPDGGDATQSEPIQANGTYKHEKGEEDAVDSDSPKPPVASAASQPVDESAQSDEPIRANGLAEEVTAPAEASAPIDSTPPQAVEDSVPNDEPEDTDDTTEKHTDDTVAADDSQKELPGCSSGKSKKLADKIAAPFLPRGRVTRRTHSGRPSRGGCVIF